MTPLAAATFRDNVRKWKTKEWKRRWQEEPRCRQAKTFLGEEPPYKKRRDLFNSSRGQASNQAGILTGHVNLNYYLHKIGKKVLGQMLLL